MTIDSVKKLNNGIEMPYFGLGVYLADQGSLTEQSVLWALEAGYRHIDTAAAYGNEADVGRAIKKSGIPRNQIFITTKLQNNDMRSDRQKEAFEESLEKLGTSYVDLYLIHWPVPGKYIKSWEIMQSILEDRRARAIGVSNFNPHHLEDLEKRGFVVPAVNQFECHPRFNQKDLVKYCEAHRIAVTAYSPLGGRSHNLCGEPELIEIGKKYDKSSAQVILRWDLQRDIITIPKSTHKKRIYENGNIFDFTLTSEDMDRIDAMDRNQRLGADPDNFNF